MKTLIIGASGQVGKRMLISLQKQGVPAVGTGNSRPGAAGLHLEPLDIRDAGAVSRLFEKIKPKFVFLSSALTAVDYCEDHPDEAHAINVQGPKNVVDGCRKTGAKLIYLSTEYVFDGTSGPYSEEDKPNPQSVYAKTKWEGENVALGLPGSVVARTTVVYDWDVDSKNFVMGLIQRLSAGQPMRVMNDQWSNPTLARNLSDVLWELATRGATGIYNTVGPDCMHRYDFAVAAAEVLGFDKSLISPVTTEELKQRAPRPLRAGLTVNKTSKFLKTKLIGVREGLALVKKDWEASRAGR